MMGLIPLYCSISKYYWLSYAFTLPGKIYNLLSSRKENVLGFYMKLY